jgi:hypothetical protein
MGLNAYHYGAIHPFMPDPRPKNWREAAETWRISEMPDYPPIIGEDKGGSIFVDAPYRGHPWLLVTNLSEMSPSSAMVR